MDRHQHGCKPAWVSGATMAQQGLHSLSCAALLFLIMIFTHSRCLLSLSCWTLQETKEAVHAVRAVKTQQARLREAGMTPGLAGKAAAAAALAVSGKTPKQSQKAKAK